MLLFASATFKPCEKTKTGSRLTHPHSTFNTFSVGTLAPRLPHTTKSSSIRLISLPLRRLFSLTLRPNFRRGRRTAQRIGRLATGRIALRRLGLRLSRRCSPRNTHLSAAAVVTAAPNTVLREVGGPFCDAVGFGLVDFANAREHDVYGGVFVPGVHAVRLSDTELGQGDGAAI